MDKLTQEQIKAVDTALWDIGIKFLDIRIEMTDHAATAIEEMEGDFKQNLENYIAQNKKELQKNYSQFRTNASVKSVKLLFWNMLSFRFIAIMAIVYALFFAEFKYEGLEETSGTFLILSVIFMCGSFMYTCYVNFVRSTKVFSTAERLMPGISGTAYAIIIPMRIMVEKQAINDSVVLLFYAFAISFFVMIVLTYRFLTTFYKSRYQVV